MARTDIYYIEVLGKAADILDVFLRLRKPRLTLQEISKAANLSKNTVFRVLYTLAEHGYVVKHQRDYELGSKLLELGQAKLGNKDLLAVAGPYLDALREKFSETVNLGVLDGHQIRYVDVRESPQRFRLAERVGASDYLHCTALGKAWLAHLPFDEVRRLLKQQGMPRQTERTIVTVSGMKAELECVRKLGYAVDREESMEGAYCVAVPVVGSGGPVAAVSVSGPTTRFGDAVLPAVSAALLAASAEIRQRLGYL